MPASTCEHYRIEILAHFCNGKLELSAEARAHFGACESCIAEVANLLDQASQSPPRRVRGASPAPPAKDLSGLPPEAQQALHHGREVLKREFGISAGTQPPGQSG